MKATKLELQQINTKLAADNAFLRGEISKRNTELANALIERNEAQKENAFLRSKLAEADHRSRKLIAATNRVRSNGIVSERRKQMEAARIAAMQQGKVVLA